MVKRQPEQRHVFRKTYKPKSVKRVANNAVRTIAIPVSVDDSDVSVFRNDDDIVCVDLGNAAEPVDVFADVDSTHYNTAIFMFFVYSRFRMYYTGLTSKAHTVLTHSSQQIPTTHTSTHTLAVTIFTRLPK